MVGERAVVVEAQQEKSLTSWLIQHTLLARTNIGLTNMAMVSVLLAETLSQKAKAQRRVVPTPVRSKTSARSCGQDIMVMQWTVLMIILGSARPAALEDRQEVSSHRDATAVSLLPLEGMTMNVIIGSTIRTSMMMSGHTQMVIRKMQNGKSRTREDEISQGKAKILEITIAFVTDD